MGSKNSADRVKVKDAKASQNMSPDRSSAASTPSPGSPAKKPCIYFMSGYCRNGSSCPDDHGPDAAAAVSPQAAASPIGRASSGNRARGLPHLVTEEQAIAIAMIQSLRDALQASPTHAERKKIRDELRTYQELLRASTIVGGGDQSSPKGTKSPPRAATSMNHFPSFEYSQDVVRKQQQHNEASEDHHECSICIAPYTGGERIVVLPCLHWFHFSCAASWLERSAQCPLCQHSVDA